MNNGMITNMIFCKHSEESGKFMMSVTHIHRILDHLQHTLPSLYYTVNANPFTILHPSLLSAHDISL